MFKSPSIKTGKAPDHVGFNYDFHARKESAVLINMVSRDQITHDKEKIMKKWHFFWLIILTVSLPNAAQVKIAYHTMQKIVATSHKAQDVYEQIDLASKPFEEELRAMDNNHQRLAYELEKAKQSSRMKDVKRKQRELQALEKEMQEYYTAKLGEDGEVKRLQEEKMLPLFNRLNNSIQSMVEEAVLDILIETDNGQILYADSGIVDLSDMFAGIMDGASIRSGAIHPIGKIACINSTEVLDAYSKARAVNAQLDSIGSEWIKEGQPLQEEYYRMAKELETTSLLLNDSQKFRKEQQLDSLKSLIMQFKNEKWGSNGELYVKYAERMQPVLDEVNSKIREIGRASGAGIIFDAATALAFKSAAVTDLTGSLINALEEPPGKTNIPQIRSICKAGVFSRKFIYLNYLTKDRYTSEDLKAVEQLFSNAVNKLAIQQNYDIIFPDSVAVASVSDMQITNEVLKNLTLLPSGTADSLTASTVKDIPVLEQIINLLDQANKNSGTAKSQSALQEAEILIKSSRAVLLTDWQNELFFNLCSKPIGTPPISKSFMSISDWGKTVSYSDKKNMTLSHLRYFENIKSSLLILVKSDNMKSVAIMIGDNAWLCENIRTQTDLPTALL